MQNEIKCYRNRLVRALTEKWLAQRPHTTIFASHINSPSQPQPLTPSHFIHAQIWTDGYLSIIRKTVNSKDVCYFGKRKRVICCEKHSANLRRIRQTSKLLLITWAIINYSCKTMQFKKFVITRTLWSVNYIIWISNKPTIHRSCKKHEGNG